VVVATQGNAPANGVFQIRVAANGVITYITPTGLGAPGIPNPATSVGGPWTTGMLTVSVTQNAGSTNEVFVLSGSDARVNGLGSISLVSGAISNRTLTAPNANRGWLNITVGQQAPTLGTWGIAALALLLAGAATMKIRKSAVA
jgi:IPTL-CTERM motif